MPKEHSIESAIKNKPEHTHKKGTVYITTSCECMIIMPNSYEKMGIYGIIFVPNKTNIVFIKPVNNRK